LVTPENFIKSSKNPFSNLKIVDILNQEGGGNMNKCLLIWNVALTILLLAMVLGGCAPTDTRISWLVDQVNTHNSVIGKLKTDTQYNRQLLQSQLAQIVTLQSYTENNIKQLRLLIESMQ
jgi:hypothetical protein